MLYTTAVSGVLPLWNNEQRQEVRHMTDAKYRIYMRRIGKDEVLKEEEYDNGSVLDALATMSAWVQDAESVANVLDCSIYVELKIMREIIVSASTYVNPIRWQ